MLKTLFKKWIGSRNDREIKRLWPRVLEINTFEASVASLSDEALRDKTAWFRTQLAEGPEETLPQRLKTLLPEAYAVVREAAKRVLGMRHFDAQLLGGIALHEGKIAEMKTGEGKTLVATLPAYLNALTGRGVHLVTVNDYLAKRDSQWMGALYRFLGLSVGVIHHAATDKERQAAYGSDITYGTNNEFGFDYLRDNMKFDSTDFVQRPLNYAIVDEVDSILIDEARTPLIISGPAEASTDLYYRINRIIPALHGGDDYTVEEKTKTVALTDAGNMKVEKALGITNLYDLENIDLVHHVIQALKAHTIFRRDVDYMVKEGEVIIVDEFTGRLMPGRRWSDGLHQAVEAKEGVKIANENQTLATITFQNYFRLYNKLAGMTGTADTEAAEFAKIYNLEVTIIPPNRVMVREDHSDIIYRTVKEKYEAIINEIVELHQKGQPILVGTISIEKSEILSGLIKQKGIPHVVLNAKYHEREAEIIAQAGRKGSVTIATNMAGRGTDILLGGNPDFLFKQYQERSRDETPEVLQAARMEIAALSEQEKREVVALGGLHIIGTERHESRRIDNQLRGRSGRQGDPGSSRFYLALEDDLLRIFGSDRIARLMGTLGMQEGEAIEHRMVTRAIENAQKRVEAHHFDARKQLLDYDDVMNQQRTVIYQQRREILFGGETREEIIGTIEEMVGEMLTIYCPEDAYSESWDLHGLKEGVSRQFSMETTDASLGLPDVGREALRETLLDQVQTAYLQRVTEFGSERFAILEKELFLRMIDTHWKDHLLAIDHLKEGIGLRGYGQREPLSEYKREGFEMFSAMMDQIKKDTVGVLLRAKLESSAEAPPTAVGPLLLQRARPQPMQLNRSEDVSATVHREAPKVGRNDACPCGSGKKFKKCCGK